MWVLVLSGALTLSFCPSLRRWKPCPNNPEDRDCGLLTWMSGKPKGRDKNVGGKETEHSHSCTRPGETQAREPTSTAAPLLTGTWGMTSQVPLKKLYKWMHIHTMLLDRSNLHPHWITPERESEVEKARLRWLPVERHHFHGLKNKQN